MDKNQAKEFYTILQAFAEGKVIECRLKPDFIKDSDNPNDWTVVKDLWYMEGKEYRIKSESRYRPFANAEECWQEMLKHQPFGWIKGKEDEYHTFITTVDNNDEMSLSGNSGWSFLGIMNNYTFADGTPFGIKEEE